MSSKHHPFSLLILLLLFFCDLSSSAQNNPKNGHVEVVMRMLGHQILLQSGDSTSLVLPIILDGNQYQIQFESEFGFIPTQLASMVDSTIKKSQISEGYLFEVVKCDSKLVVYSFEVGDSIQFDIIPCAAREQPKGCYAIHFTLMNSSPSYLSSNSDSSGLSWFVALLLFFLVGLYFWRKRNISDSESDTILIGEYQFDKKNMTLAIKDQKTELSNKESDLLLLLYSYVNRTVKRERILNAVWGDEGDYVGRTLDVFISKLRKKLDADPQVKIVNARGIGYKLIVNNQ